MGDGGCNLPSNMFVVGCFGLAETPNNKTPLLFEGDCVDCQEARKLISQGITPDSKHPLNARLGFHLAQCAACRTFRDNHHDLLAELLSQHPAPDSNQTTQQVQSEHAITTPSHRFTTTLVHRLTHLSLSHILWLCSIFLLVFLPLFAIFWFTTVLVRAHQNISTMVITTPSSIADAPLSPDTHANPARIPAPTPSPLPPETSFSGTSSISDVHEIAVEQSVPSSIRSTPPVPTVPTVESVPDDSQQESIPLIQAYATPIATRLPDVMPGTWPTIQSVLPTPTYTPIPLGAQPRPPRNWNPDTLPLAEPVNILLLGTDRRPGETDVPRTDAIMLIRADPQRHRIALLSLPRDLWVTIPEYGTNRINAAYVWGEVYQASGGGIGLAGRTINNLLGIRVDYVIVVDFEGFIGLIDTLGGVTVDVEKELYDPTFPTMDYGYMTAHFLPGPTHMDGHTALIYSRIRHPDSDFVRTRRQQSVIVAILNRLHERGDVQNLATIDQITGALVGFVQTDMQEERIISLIWALRDISADAVERYAVSSDMVTWGVENDPYALLPVQPAISELVQGFMGNP